MSKLAHRRATARRIVAVAGAAAVMLAACGGGSDPVVESTPQGTSPSTEVSESTVVTNPATSSPTTSPDTTPETTVEPVPASPPTIAELQAIMPTVDEVGAGFEFIESPEPIAEDARVLDEESLVACPGLAEVLYGEEVDEAEKASVRFSEPASTRTVEVQMAVEPELNDVAAAQAEYDSLIAAVEACPLIVGEVAGIGLYTAFPTVERVDDLGDTAFRFKLEGDIVNEAAIIPMDFHITFWVRDGVSVAVAGTSGLDDALEAVPIDDATLDVLAADVDDRLADLLT